jgi:hypothetical protein
MDLRFERCPDFEAEITILTAEQGGRKSPLFNGIRWDFGYAEDPPGSEIYMIHPLFMDDHGDPYPFSQQIEGTLKAHMFIVVREMAPYHKARLAVGTEFQCREASKTLANGRVTRLIGLAQEL